MNYRDQKKYIDALKRYENKMDSREREDFKMFVKRQKDEEEFDTVSLKTLSDLYGKYYLNRPKKSWDDLFKKPDETSNGFDIKD
ncbi:hypothetical protein MNBD_IGNAVI01-2077 [hydrothermal vent metagenome]|uniref:Uncharacterized protein n=1 Tax=hydrothermal vent metagenome TaxID=652676 RepID=A0A3B1BP91_9ZZZZ